ncbi:MAG: FAD-binding oxidoreductase [Phascolarctobacterium sp.]|uniref:FAD-binding oxidoreductase n=1 Tax=Phascolarctobacterium sp. TaxID=2049039 RepID=UPI0026DBD1A3|nr:FAD-binding oxidoreductase [Phascolarctobacterium sp.]MDO4920383.1 FAD-binding oxidoreductase [Phascolarctobacterium sp.]
MQAYNKVSEAMLEELRAAVGAENVITDLEKLDQYKTDEEYDPRRFRVPEAVVRPANPQEVAAVVKLCNKYMTPVTVRSGGTSLADGAIAVCGGIVLLMERMNKIIEMNTEGMYMVVEAGVRTVDIQKLANEAGYLYAGDPCSAESCLIGGNLATNAGGNKAVRYGVTRNQVYGLEMVTPTGEIVEVGARLKKCSTGYCMEQLVMGSEGTLGIITKATLKLQPLPPYRFDLLAVFDDPMKALDVVPRIMQAGLNPTSMEYMDNSYVRATADFIEFKGAPHYEDGIYVIITVETFTEDELDSKMEQLNDLCEEAGAVDVLEADDRIWAMRRNCQESISLVSKVSLTDDVVVPVDKIATTIKEIMHIGSKYPFPIPVKINAHIGDGNLHIVLCKCDMSDEEWESTVHAFHEEVYAYAYAQGGRLAGEHGIGAKKLNYMEEFTPAGELELMRKIKRAWDPNNILNPGKVFNA